MRTLSGLRSPLTRARRRGRRHEFGHAAVELALITPVLMVLTVGAFDFGRIFYYTMAVTGAAHAGAQWGSMSAANASNTAGMTTRVENHAPGLGVTASPAPTRICRCGNGTATPNPQACNVGCTGTLRIYASVTARRTFSPIARIPGIPSTITIVRTAQMRAQ